MVWTSMLAMIVLSAFAFHGCFKQYRLMSGLSDDDLDRIESDRWDQNLDIDMTSLIKVQLESILSNRKVWLLFTILTGTIFFILFITFIFLRKRVRIAISLIREASKSVFCFILFISCHLHSLSICVRKQFIQNCQGMNACQIYVWSLNFDIALISFYLDVRMYQVVCKFDFFLYIQLNS